MTRYKRGVTLAGIIYAHPITTERMDGPPLRILRMFADLCGHKYAKNVVYLTTRWDEVVDADVAEQRQKDLEKSYWNRLISHGAATGRFYIDDPKSSWVIVDELIQRHQPRQAFLLQEEMVDCRKLFNQTTAAKALSRRDTNSPPSPPVVHNTEPTSRHQRHRSSYKTVAVKAGNIEWDDIVIA